MLRFIQITWRIALCIIWLVSIPLFCKQKQSSNNSSKGPIETTISEPCYDVTKIGQPVLKPGELVVDRWPHVNPDIVFVENISWELALYYKQNGRYPGEANWINELLPSEGDEGIRESCKKLIYISDGKEYYILVNKAPKKDLWVDLIEMKNKEMVFRNWSSNTNDHNQLDEMNICGE